MVDLPDPKPVEDIRHKCLKPHILDTSDKFRRLEVLVSRIAAPLAEVVDEVPLRFN
jgi:hypothetical protein